MYEAAAEETELRSVRTDFCAVHTTLQHRTVAKPRVDMWNVNGEKTIDRSIAVHLSTDAPVGAAVAVQITAPTHIVCDVIHWPTIGS